MAASYPTSLKTWTPVTDNSDYVLDHHVNDLYDEVIALETECISFGKCATAAGTANAITLDTRGTFDLTRDGNWITFTPAAINTGAVTIALDGQAAKGIKKWDIVTAAYVDLSYGDLKAYCPVTIVYNTTAGHFVYTPRRDAAAGTIVMYGGSTVPFGYLLCDGTAVSRTTYAELFNAISTNYGTGNGSTTFNLPDFRGNAPVGYKSTDTDFDALGHTGGEKTHTLTEAELASHSHGTTAADGTPTWLTDFTTGYAPRMSEATYVLDGDAAGSGNAHNNLQPYLVANFIIKY